MLFFFAKKKNVHGLLHFGSITYKALQFFQWWWEKKRVKRERKKCRFTEKRLFYTCDENDVLLPANVIFLDSWPKAFLGAHPKALCVKRIESKVHPFPTLSILPMIWAVKCVSNFFSGKICPLSNATVVQALPVWHP